MSPAEREFSLQNKEEIEQQLIDTSILEEEIRIQEHQAQAAERSIAAVVRAGEDAVFNQGIQDAEDSFTQDFAEDLEIAVLEQNQERLDALAEEEVEIQKAQEILDAYRAEQEQLEKMNRQTQDEIARLDEILEYDQANREDEARLDRETIQTQAEKEAKRFFEENRPNDID
jgi:hypothetical protein